MIRSAFAILVTLVALSSSVQAGWSADEIMKKVDDRDTGEDALSLLKMKLDRSGRTEEREIVWWSWRRGEKFKHLIKFKSPKTLKDSGLLIDSPGAGPDRLWLYLSKAAKAEPRQISAEDKEQSFLGSDFSYVDLEDRDAADFKHTALGEEKWGEFDCYKIQSEPKDPGYAYSRLVSWIDRSRFVPVKIELYKKDRLEKIFEVQKLEAVQGLWTLRQSTMTQMNGGKKTTLDLVNIKYNSKLPESHFSFEKLTAEL